MERVYELYYYFSLERVILSVFTTSSRVKLNLQKTMVTPRYKSIHIISNHKNKINLVKTRLQKTCKHWPHNKESTKEHSKDIFNSVIEKYTFMKKVTIKRKLKQIQKNYKSFTLKNTSVIKLKKEILKTICFKKASTVIYL